MFFLWCLSGGSSERTARCAIQHPEASIPLSCREHTDVAEPDLGAADARSVLLVVQLSVVVETGRDTIRGRPADDPNDRGPRHHRGAVSYSTGDDHGQPVSGGRESEAERGDLRAGVGPRDRRRHRVAPGRDGAAFRVAAMWLTDAELADFLRDVQQRAQPRRANARGKGRRRRVLYTVLLPAPEQQSSGGGPAACPGRARPAPRGQLGRRSGLASWPGLTCSGIGSAAGPDASAKSA